MPGGKAENKGSVMADIKHIDRVSFRGFTDNDSWLNNWPWKRVNHGLLFDRTWTSADGYNVYGLKWNKEVIKWRADGAMVHKMENTPWHQP